ncbi:S-adenosylmethionine:tRNA ribosyltransferase-isomerase [Cyclobacterium jeungdonense]|uniref:S-adenosylmethionine:tRNA ribosyltransferase-isomerase n=2 Tax=Cyclobacterium jeungdonense TaxID=708087 RepID=A0ABT8CA29_9BACT|nr:S-adenosylmethionine:tRNA ribosyltransferase-isomerase [Cyclobacterium jeungdonense]MDN3688620.1 S-adenosylmethionine:tRNA ribosyltransferase-isomerase [Cyclobacterium jeungdonense]
MEITPTLKDYDYHLPEAFIAKFPLKKRDASKLLHYENGKIQHFHFWDLPAILPANTHLVFNDTKVIPARLHFRKSTGAAIELFLLTPLRPSTLIPQSMQSHGPVVWECMVGNLKRWKEGEEIECVIPVNQKNVLLRAKLLSKDTKEVEFRWEPAELTFASIVEASGEVPLPPYLNRKANDTDKLRYQTVYSKTQGAVAAPTAGLHFTENTLSEIKKRKITLHYLTLHVGAGTFLPIKHQNILDHPMHREQMVFSKENIANLCSTKGNIVAVGTTSLRSLESLYWYGVKLISGTNTEFHVDKLEPYTGNEKNISKEKSFEAILSHLESTNQTYLIGTTEIFIFPGYRFRVCNGLVTNFHQPCSTLILLIAAFTHQQWREIYEEALNKEYRFLSYGDSSLLWNNKRYQ